MLFAVSAVAAIGFLDQQREAAATMADFSREQSMLARAIAAEVRTRLELRARAEPRRRAPILLEEMLTGVRHFEVPGSLILLVARPHDPGFVATDGRLIPSEKLSKALDAGTTHLLLERDEAAAFGLPPRIAAAGLARVDAGEGGVWSLAVIESAQRIRERQERGRVRLGLGVLLAASLVVTFGGIALLQQRKELELERELAVRAIEVERDAQLIRADKMATLAALSTGIAHELATPLGVILGRAEQLVGRLEGDDRGRRNAEAIVEQIDRIQRVMRGFLALARGEAPVLDRVAPGDLVRVAVGLVRHRFAKAHVEVVVDVADRLPLVSCDPPLTEQALVNLLLNACEACPPGGRVEIAAREEDGKVALRVTDDGDGITEQAARRAHEPFFTTKERGTGLGLAIANEIVKHQGGALSIGPRADHGKDGAPRRGTQAAITLPIAAG